MAPLSLQARVDLINSERDEAWAAKVKRAALRKSYSEDLILFKKIKER